MYGGWRERRAIRIVYDGLITPRVLHNDMPRLPARPGREEERAEWRRGKDEERNEERERDKWMMAGEELDRKRRTQRRERKQRRRNGMQEEKMRGGWWRGRGRQFRLFVWRTAVGKHACWNMRDLHAKHNGMDFEKIYEGNQQTETKIVYLVCVWIITIHFLTISKTKADKPTLINMSGTLQTRVKNTLHVYQDC